MAINIIYSAVVKPLLCDKLSLTMNIPVKDQPNVTKMLKDQHSYPSSAYCFNVKLALNSKLISYLSADTSGDTVLFIQAAPKKPNLNFLRFEWNPAKVDSAMLVPTIEHFLPPLMSYAELLDKATVTRFDATVDVIGCPIDRMLLYSQKKQWSELRFKSGRTMYLGDDGSSAQFCIYDKAAEIQEKNKKKCKELKEGAPAKAITRIEVRLKPKNLRLKNLVNLPSPFADLVVAAYPPQALRTSLAKQTLRLARHEGMDAALKNLSSAERGELKALLKPYQMKWWNPEAVWEQLPALLEQLVHADTIEQAA